jgi:hypothetical protein
MNITARTTMADLQREGLRLRYLANLKKDIRRLHQKRDKSFRDVRELQRMYAAWRSASVDA